MAAHHARQHRIAAAEQWTSTDSAGLGAPPRRAQLTSLLSQKAEGEGFEPSSDPKARNGFRDCVELAFLQALSPSFASSFASTSRLLSRAGPTSFPLAVNQAP